MASGEGAQSLKILSVVLTRKIDFCLDPEDGDTAAADDDDDDDDDNVMVLRPNVDVLFVVVVDVFIAA